MSLRKILLYGGCHALVLRDLLAAHFGEQVEATLLVNFELIRSGRPFPYEWLKQFDVVLYSPISNKGEYNTIHLVEACRAMKIDVFCYPWLEWHGYCPGATKANFKNRFQWQYQSLSDAARSFGSFEDFADWAIEAYPDDATIAAAFNGSHEMLHAAEQRHDMAIRASDFILENYRYSRLFMISDHPSLKLYLHILRQILDLLGVPDGGVCERVTLLAVEPQRQCRTPIFPRVESRLDLRFSDACWVDEDIVPEHCLDLRSYLLLYYHKECVILGPKESASISPMPGPCTDREVRATTRLVANRVAEGADDARDEYRLLEVLAGDALPLARNQLFRIDTRHWTSAWG